MAHVDPTDKLWIAIASFQRYQEGRWTRKVCNDVLGGSSQLVSG